MPHGSAHLNDKQIHVLRWVAEGAPSDRYEPGDYAHRITAKALASRGLIRVEGRGTTWTAKLTAAGEERAAELNSVAEAVPEDNADVAALIARLDDAGGRLELDERTENVRYGPLIVKANKSNLRPHGRELHLSPARWETPWLQVLEYREWFWDLVDTPGVAAVPAGSRLGELAKAFLGSKDDQFVTKESLHRAARLLESIVRYAAKHDLTVRDPRAIDDRARRDGGRTRGWSGHLELDAGSTVQRLQVRELPGRGGGQFDYNRGFLKMDQKIYNEVQRLPTWQRNRNHWFVPTGKLELRIARPGFSFDGTKWVDTKALAVEQRLGEVFRYIEVARLEGEAAQRRAKETEQQKERDWKAAMTRAEARFRASQEEALLAGQAARWSRQREVLEFIDELRRRASEVDPAASQWITIGERVARRLDPFAALAKPVFAKPSTQDLEPYLDGWSAFGPHRRP